MLNLLVLLVAVLFAAGVVWWLVGYLAKYFGAEIVSIIRGLVLIFAVVFILIQLWTHRALFHVGS